MGTTTDTHVLPVLTKTHGRNKANQVKFTPTTLGDQWRNRCEGIRLTVRVNASTSKVRLHPNTTIQGIKVHRFNAISPPLPEGPARQVPSPTSFDDAVFGAYGDHWRPAYQKEIDSLFRYGVWELQLLPRGAMELPCKLVFKVKPNGCNPPGISKFKVRYCAKGFYQIKGKHYHHTFAPVAASLTVRLVISIANEMGWPIHGMDVSNAYLNAEMEPDIVLFVRPPPTIFVPRGYGLRLLKPLYGTMQGVNRWAHHKHEFLTSINMVRNAADPSLYHRHDQYGFVLFDIIVDDFKITGWPLAAVARIKAQLAAKWDMTDLGELKYFANVEIRRDRETRRTTLKQTQYIHP